MFKTTEALKSKPGARFYTLPRRKWDDVEFVKVWMQCATVREVASHFDVTEIKVSQKASMLRHKGVKLPLKQKHINQIDKLNKLIDKLKG